VRLEYEDGSEITIDISRELVIKARMLGWSSFELVAEAVQAWSWPASDVATRTRSALATIPRKPSAKGPLWLR